MIRVFKFKKNDLNPSGGKQIEYSISDVKDFFQFPSDEETVEFRYTSVIPNDPLNGLRFKSTFKLSQARGDYKCYGNPDGSINLKSFFLDKLHLTPEDNLEDSYALKKLGQNSFALAYFPKGIDFTTVSQFFYSENTTTETPDSVNQPLDEPLQQIFFGAPGTGKSFKINEACAHYENYRTTFHPDTDYASFVGSYKPITEVVTKYDMHGHAYPEKRIVYTYVFQAFLKAYIAAWREQQKGNPKPVFLVVEEINRGNCAQIFGDIFQLLDRNESGYSDYPIVADDDLAQELKREFENLNVANPQAINSLYLGDKDIVGSVKSGKQLLLPNNLYIWATMNTSDQSLFPIDSAFKRRWDWKYIKIQDGKKDYKIVFSNGNEYDWWSFVTEINNRIEGGEIQQEDKKLGYFFAKSKDGFITADRFLSKVIFFLYNDVFKDFGFDEDFFKGADGQPMTFASYFDEAGESNEAQIERFLNNLGLEPNSSSDEDKEESEVEVVADASDGFYVSGEKCSRRACQGLIVSKAIETANANGESLTVADLSDIAKRTFITPRGKQMNKPFFVLASDWENYKATSSDPRVTEKFETNTLIDTDGVEFYVYCNFGGNDEQNLGNFANALGVSTIGLLKQ